MAFLPFYQNKNKKLNTHSAGSSGPVVTHSHPTSLAMGSNVKQVASKKHDSSLLIPKLVYSDES